jgi:hypothetical protein
MNAFRGVGTEYMVSDELKEFQTGYAVQLVIK